MACLETWDFPGVQVALDSTAYLETQDHKDKRWVLTFPGCLLLTLVNWAYNMWIINFVGWLIYLFLMT